MQSNPEKPPVSHPLRWLPEFLELSHKRLRPQARLLGFSLVVGVLSGLGGVVFFVVSHAVFHFAMNDVTGYHPKHPSGEHEIFDASATVFRPWMLLIVPTIGGLISGIIVFTFAPEAEGHGTDGAIAAYHRHQGKIPPRVPLVKIIASAITIGTGGSGGREGPIAQIGAGIGSYLGGLLRMRPAERRILLAAGMGAGIAAVFRAPLAGALFTAEVLYRSPDFESEVIIPAGLASVMAYCTFGIFFGWSPLFDLDVDVINVLTFTNPAHLITYTALALVMVILAMVYTRTFYGLNYLFRRLPIRPHFKPAIGGFLTGGLGLGLYFLMACDQRVLAVLSSGYGIAQDVMTVDRNIESDLWFALLLVTVSFGKILTTGFTIGSGGSGGVFGPSMVIGGAAGGALGIFVHHFFPWLVPHPANLVIIGMAGFFAAAAKTPFSTLVIVSEMTGNYNLLLPTLWVCTISFLLSDERSIYSSQVESRSRSPAHQGDYVRDVLTGLYIRQFLSAKASFPSLAPGDRLEKVLQKLDSTSLNVLPVMDDEKRLLGVVSLQEVHLASQSPNLRPFLLAEDLMRNDIHPLGPDDRLDRAIELFVENDLPALPVVDDTPERRVLGIVTRSDVSNAYLRHVHGTPQSDQSPDLYTGLY